MRVGSHQQCRRRPDLAVRRLGMEDNGPRGIQPLVRLTRCSQRHAGDGDIETIRRTARVEVADSGVERPQAQTDETTGQQIRWSGGCDAAEPIG